MKQRPSETMHAFKALFACNRQQGEGVGTEVASWSCMVGRAWFHWSNLFRFYVCLLGELEKLDEVGVLFRLLRLVYENLMIFDV